MNKHIILIIITLFCVFNLLIAQSNNSFKSETLLISSKDIINNELPFIVKPNFLLIKDTYYSWLDGHWSDGQYKLWHYNNNNMLKQIENMQSLYKINFFYDQDSNVVCKERIDFNQSEGKWICTSIDSFCYDNKARLILENKLLFETNRLKKNNKSEYSYDSIGRLCERKIYYGNYIDDLDTNGIWILENIILYKYDTNNNLLDILPTYNTREFLKISYNYNADNLKISENGYSWYEDKWNIVYQFVWSYDNNGNNIESYHNWYESQIYRFLYDYDEFGNQIKKTYQKFINNVWDTTYLSFTNYTYDENYNLIKEMKTIYENGTVNNSYLIEYEYDEINIIKDPSKYFFYPIILFPNPCHYYINIKLNRYSQFKVSIFIYNTDGQILNWKEIIPSDNEKIITINTKNFKSGVYFVKILFFDDIQYGKFIKE